LMQGETRPMTSEIKLAFAHPSERAEATSDALRDRISLRDHIREVEIGAFQAERGTTQRICFNVVVEVRLHRELGSERLNLLETLAERVAEDILADPRAARVFVRIEKLDRGPGALGVEIVRDRETSEVATPEPIHPIVVFLEAAAVADAGLSQRLDQIAGAGAPVILCVGQNEAKSLKADHPAAQRRIDLLALEQQAWVLAARDARCVVVSTRKM